jgi:hypothetical protein
MNPNNIPPQTTAANISPFATPDLKSGTFTPGGTVTVTATPSQLLTDITAGATPAPLLPVASTVNGNGAAVLQPTTSPQFVAS